MAAQELAGHLDVLFTIEAQDDYWKVATDSLRPKTRLRQLIERQDMRPGPQRRIRVQDATGEPLKQMGLVGIDVQVTHLDLRPGPGHARFTFENIRVAILFGQRDCVVPRLGHAGRENNLGGFVRRQAHPASQTENRIEDGADRVRERAILHYSYRLGGGVATAEKTRPISFKLDPGDRFG